VKDIEEIKMKIADKIENESAKASDWRTAGSLQKPRNLRKRLLNKEDARNTAGKVENEPPEQVIDEQVAHCKKPKPHQPVNQTQSQFPKRIDTFFS
jgi:hypothetical protein